MTMTASATQLEKKLSLVANKKRLLKKTNEALRRKYGAQNKVVENSVGKVIKSVATRFVGMEI